jgi:hypothetical protein
MFSRASITMSAGADLVVEGAIDFLEELLVLCALVKDGGSLTSCSVPKIDAR